MRFAVARVASAIVLGLAVAAGFAGEAMQDAAPRLCAGQAARAGCDFCACFAPGTPESYRHALDQFMRSALPPGAAGYQTASAWGSTASGPHTSGTPVQLTWSFVADFNTGDPATSNVLFSEMDSQFGSRSAWQNLIRDCFASWSQEVGIEFVEVPDDGQEFPDTPGALGSRGDIRIIAQEVDGVDGILAFAYFPNGGDVTLDRDENWADPADDHRFLRNVLRHELGHALGLEHVTPLDETKLMEPLYSNRFDGPQDDDLRGAIKLYSDPSEPNDTAAQASSLGVFQDGRTIAGLALSRGPDVDWYSLAVAGGSTIAVDATPLGTSYLVGPDPGSPHTVNSQRILPMSIDVFRSDGTSALASFDASAGQPARSGAFTIPLGDSLVLIRVSSASSTADVQRYSLTTTSGTPLERQISITSTLSGVSITLSPATTTSLTSATAPQVVSYLNGTSVTLTAPAMQSSQFFARWLVDGEKQEFGNRVLHVLMDGNHTVSAAYAALAVEAGADQAIVSGDAAQLTVAVIGGVEPLTFQWTPSEDLSSASAAEPTAAPTESTDYTVSVRDSMGRTAMDTTHVTVYPPLTASAGADKRVIGNTRFALKGSVDGGTPPYTYAWSPGSLLDNDTSLNPTGLISSDTNFQLTVIDSSGRTAHDDVHVRIAPALTLEAAQESVAIRAGAQTTLEVTPGGGAPPYLVTWSPTGVNFADVGLAIHVAPASTTRYVATATDELNQVATVTIEVTVAAPLSVQVEFDATAISRGEATAITAVTSGGQKPFTYTWTPADSLDQDDARSVLASPAQTTMYEVTVTDAAGQRKSASITIEVTSSALRTGGGGCGAGAGLSLGVVTIGLMIGRRRVR